MCASVFVVNQSFRSILTVAIFIAAINISVKKIIKSILTIIGLVFVILYYVDNVEMNGRLADYVNGIRMFIENPVLADLAIEKGLNGSQVRITLLVEGVKYLVNNITILGLGIGGSYSVFEQLIDFKAYSHNNLINVLMDLGLIGGILYYVPLYKMITIAETREMRGVMTGFSVSIFMAGFYGGKTHIILPVLVMMAILISYNEHVKRKNTY
jgi:hypothetical protein